MSVFDTYFSRYLAFETQIKVLPHANTGIIVVIPCYNEPDVLSSLQSLFVADKPKCAIEVIVVINASERESSVVKAFNYNTYNLIKEWADVHNSQLFNVYPLLFDNLQHKFAGVGWARKIGMDEALRRFDYLNNDKGVIVGFDADSTCSGNYFTELERYFANIKYTACSIYFEHPTYGGNFDDTIYKAILLYELHLRYYIAGMRYTGVPYAYHTIGSSFAVRAYAYAGQGGMNRRKAGEDFYFLHKIIAVYNYGNLTTSTVFPSPRTSTRVPFGTGAAMLTIVKNNSLYTYNINVFKHIRSFISQLPLIYNNQNTSFNPVLEQFLQVHNYNDLVLQAKDNSSSFESFVKRFYSWFDAFMFLKAVNFMHENYLEKQSILEAAHNLALTVSDSVSDSLSSLQLLTFYRNNDKLLFENSNII